MTIKEVSKRYHISEATLRYYEKEGLIFDVKRKNRIRNYTERNLPNIEFVICMRSAGMSMERLKQYISLFHVPNSEIERKQILILQKKEIEEQIDVLMESLKRLDYKIKNYEKMIDLENK